MVHGRNRAAGGTVLNPLLLAATNDIPPEDAGVASGAVNSSFMMGGALSLGVLATVSAARAGGVVTSGHPQLAALNSGYHIAFAVGAGLAVAAACLTPFLDQRSGRR